MKEIPPVFLCLALPLFGTSVSGAPITVEGRDFFEQKIRPVLVAECYECHGAQKQKGGLRLDSRPGWQKGGEAGEVIVPVIVVDATVSDPDLVLCQVASDNVEAGRIARESLAKVKPNAKRVIVHYSVNKACIDRVDGFKAEMAKHPGMKLLDTRAAAGTTETVRPVMRDMRGRFPDLDAVFPINDPGALGCISAAEASGRAGQISVVTVDGSQETAWCACSTPRSPSSTVRASRSIYRPATASASSATACAPKCSSTFATCWKTAASKKLPSTPKALPMPFASSIRVRLS